MVRDQVVRQPGKYDGDKVSAETGLKCEDESLTVQSEKDDADINTIVRRYGITGAAPVGLRVPSYEDYGDVTFDFQSALNAVKEAEDTFMQLPADVRFRFANDPQRFLMFCTELSDDEKSLKNLDEMRKMGLAVPEAVPPPEVIQKVEVVNERFGESDSDARASSGKAGKKPGRDA